MKKYAEAVWYFEKIWWETAIYRIKNAKESDTLTYNIPLMIRIGKALWGDNFLAYEQLLRCITSEDVRWVAPATE